MMLFIFDIYAPTHGVLTMGGIISFSDRLAHAIQPRRPALSFILELHYSGNAYDGGILCFRLSEKACARNGLPVKAGAGNHGWKKQ